MLALPIGLVAASKRGTVYDNVLMVVALLGQSTPTFWLGIISIWFFGVKLGLLPTFGRGGLEHLVLPSFTLGAYFAARIARITRSSMLDALGQQYVVTARAKGLAERIVVYRHAFRNACISVITVVGLTFAGFMGGSVITETIFAWPGVGWLMIKAVLDRDYPLAQGCVLVVATVVVLTNAVVDVAYACVDPRVKLA
jgi:ABC-type dipeptide/oligopeptide/nickel transport system permease component